MRFSWFIASTLSLLFSASYAWELDERCPGYARRLQQRADFYYSNVIANADNEEYHDPAVAMEGPNSLPKLHLRGAEEQQQSQQQQSNQNHRDLQSIPSTFQLKLHWETGACWQDEWIERKWCMVCNGGVCQSGKPIRIEFCNATKWSQRFRYVPVVGSGGGRIKPASNANLCFERNATQAKLAACRNNTNNQIFVGFQGNGSSFEIKPKGATELCITNDKHHPKAQEVIFLARCANIWDIHTSEWIITVGTADTSNRLTASELTNLKVRNNSSSCSVSRPCEKCQGNCQYDSHCQSPMKCFQRNGTEKVPGCYGRGGVSTDYCYDPSARN